MTLNLDPTVPFPPALAYRLQYLEHSANIIDEIAWRDQIPCLGGLWKSIRFNLANFDIVFLIYGVVNYTAKNKNLKNFDPKLISC